MASTYLNDKFSFSESCSKHLALNLPKVGMVFLELNVTIIVEKAEIRDSNIWIVIFSAPGTLHLNNCIFAKN